MNFSVPRLLSNREVVRRVQISSHRAATSVYRLRRSYRCRASVHNTRLWPCLLVPSSSHLNIHVEGMASTLPNEIIAMIADYMVEDGQYVICHDHFSFRSTYCYDSHRKHRALLTPPTTLALFHLMLLAEYAKLLHRKAIFYFYDSACLYEYICRPDLSQAALELRRSMRRVRIFLLRPKRHTPDCLYWIPATPCSLDCKKSARNLRQSMHLLPKVETVHIDNRLPCSYFCEAVSHLLFLPDSPLCKELVYELWPLIERVQDLRNVFAGGDGEFGKLPPSVVVREVDGFTSPFLRALSWVRCNNVHLTPPF